MLELEAAAALLEASDDYRVLRRLKLAECIEKSDDLRFRKGMFLDVESTGLDPVSSEIIELAIIPFDYNTQGQITAIDKPLHQFNEPAEPIPPEITVITGLTNDIVAGHRLDIAAVELLVTQADLILAHNAAFDRPFAERLSPVFASKPWGCTMCDVPWKEEGIEGRRLADLLGQFHYFFDAHRAIDDCEAGIALLTKTLPRSGLRVLARLLDVARRPTWRIFAEGAPFEAKDILKLRGYKWNTDGSIGPKSWWIDIQKSNLEDELNYLRAEIFKRSIDLPIFEITAFQRYSTRVRKRL
ncbi:3'-5' exonuclease [Gluconacetobacter sp. Hr-1-5]|uniref:3'-5' exonuclease n=1 Tax=Gluconacetobacter sp. Hr-1-5 TaxID=3395370 RepID=UPI003B5160FE